MRLSDPLSTTLLRTTQPFIDALFANGLRTVQDLVEYVPRTYEDLSEVVTLADAPPDRRVTFRGTIHTPKLVRTRSRKQIVQATFQDESGAVATVVWFNQPHMMRMIHDGQHVTLSGKVTEDGYALKILSPTLEDARRPAPLHAGRIVAVYPQSDRLTTRWLREKIALIRPVLASLPETLPSAVLHDEGLMSRADAYDELHAPSTPERLAKARERLAFEEIFRIQVEALRRKAAWQGERLERLKVPMDVELIKAFFACQSYTPTGAQKVAIYEILRDMEQDRPMSRLLEGDVGSGKTFVAVAVIANALAHRGQCAIMVPTEVLARQHLTTVSRLLLAFHTFVQRRGFAEKGIHAEHLLSLPLPRVALLTGSMPHADASAVRRDLATGLVDVVIGTHALIEDSVNFRRFTLAIIDEQHRFGVHQRERLAEKGSPHVLAMTATPIPRTLALTAYGDHDLSVLLEKPGHRPPIRTAIVRPADRRTVELFIDQEIDQGRQVYVICPLITESSSDEMSEVRSVEQECERLQAEFPRRRIGCLHGRLSPEKKSEVMQAFKNGSYDLLVSTSVIEVGIDVPNATIMVIEGAERFGLSQLHQFRGRVGRSDVQSHCFLFTTTAEQARSQRLQAMEQHASGFELAEIDLRLRGPGELLGLRQSGIPEMRFGGLLDVGLVVRARRAAERWLHDADA